MGRIGAGREPDDRAGIAQHRSRDRAVGWANGDGVMVDLDPFVLGRIDRLLWLDVLVALFVSINDRLARAAAPRPPWLWLGRWQCYLAAIKTSGAHRV